MLFTFLNLNLSFNSKLLSSLMPFPHPKQQLVFKLEESVWLFSETSLFHNRNVYRGLLLQMWGQTKNGSGDDMLIMWVPPWRWAGPSLLTSGLGWSQLTLPSLNVTASTKVVRVGFPSGPFCVQNPHSLPAHIHGATHLLPPIPRCLQTSGDAVKYFPFFPAMREN